MLDYHCHILPAIDDGPDTMEESIEMAVALRQNGYDTVYCTPHLIKGFYEADNNDVKNMLSALREKLRAENISITLIPGREYYLDEFLFDFLEDPLPMGETNYIMVEIPNHMPRGFVREACFRIKRKGFIPLIAHPERNNHFFPRLENKPAFIPYVNLPSGADDLKTREPSLLSYLKNIGCAFQANMGSFTGLYGARVRQAADVMKEKNIYTHFGTDAHSLKAVQVLTENGKKE
ncbi:MAG TPA: hypothetical protein ENN23_04820 [Deltaproteobacteria bacterium]|nr:hypothetical protein [Deltaproteobacteria bacterium]